MRLGAGDEGPHPALQPVDQLRLRPDLVGLVVRHVEVSAEALDDLGKHRARHQHLLHGQPRKRVKPATGSRTVTSWLAVAAGSAWPSDMPHTSIWLGGAPMCSMMMR